MTRFATILTAAAVLAGSTQLALAERHEVSLPQTHGTEVQVPAGSFLAGKDLSRAGLKAGDLIPVTLLPAGAPAADYGNDH